MAIAGCRASHGGDAADLYPDEDRPLLLRALQEAGADPTAVSWDDEGADWARFDLTVVLSTWDSVDRPREYLTWARRTARATTLVNQVEAIEWNIDKTYLRALQARGVAVVPTDWVVEGDRWAPPLHEFVVKPSISAGGRETARYRPEEAAAAGAHARRLLGGGSTVMVQPYLTSVDTDGEAKLVFIGGEFSHAVRVGALLAASEGVVERPWERFVPMDAMAPSSAQLAAAHDVMAAVTAEVGLPLLYARVDLVTAPDGRSLLTEVELVDPSLFLRFVPAAAGRLAQAITARAAASKRHS